MEISNDACHNVVDDTCGSDAGNRDDVVIDDAVPGDHAGDANSNVVEDAVVEGMNNAEVNGAPRANTMRTSEAGPLNPPFNFVNGDSYALRAARTAGYGSNVRPTESRPSPRGANEMPKRPKSALFTPSRSTSARSVFEALRSVDIEPKDIQCLQRKMNGEVVITFKSEVIKEKFLSLTAINIEDQGYAIQDIDRPPTYLTIYDAPFELSDLGIIKRLTPYCEVISYRRGKFDFTPVYNGLRHYRVRIIKPIPSFLRFGKLQICLRYPGQPPTCRGSPLLFEGSLLMNLLT